jgi:hypothetical protein
MMGGFEPDPLIVDPSTLDGDFVVKEMPLDLSPLRELGRQVDRQVWALREAEPQELRGGFFTMTPDGRPLIGPWPEVPGLWLATGCNGAGFSLSPAVGQVLAEWIATGEPSIDLGSLHPARFARRTFSEMHPDDLLRAAAICQKELTPALADDWTLPAGDLTWDCRRTLDHIADALTLYAAHLACRARHRLPVVRSGDPTLSVADLLAVVAAMAADGDHGRDTGPIRMWRAGRGRSCRPHRGRCRGPRRGGPPHPGSPNGR